MKLAGTNALITGGSEGLGRVIAETFLREGANVMVCARDSYRLNETRRELAAAAAPGQKLLAHPCDVSSEQQVNDLAAAAIAEFGSVQALVTNAGIYGPMGPTESVPLNEWRRALDINLYGVLLPCRALIPHFKAVGRGKIIVISGGGATTPMPNISAYAASKAAAVRLMETLSEELRAFSIDVNAVAPGALRTRMMQAVLDAGPERVGADFHAKNVTWANNGATPPSLAADLSVYLASSESDGVTGRLISAQWDPWQTIHNHKDELGDIFTLRRIVPSDRGKTWG